MIATKLRCCAVALACLALTATARGAEEPAPLPQPLTADDQVDLKWYTETIERDATDPFYFLQRALLLWRSGDREAARRDFTAARKLDPHRADVQEGYCHLHFGDLNEALKLFDAAIAARPQSDVYYYRAQVHRKRKRVYKAFDDLERAIENAEPLSQDFCSAKLELARIYYDLGRDQESVDAATDAINRHFTIALAEARRGGLIFPLLPDQYYVRARAYKRLGDHQRAIIDYRTCEELGAEWFQLYEGRAECHHALRQFDAEQADRARLKQLRAEVEAENRTLRRDPGTSVAR